MNSSLVLLLCKEKSQTVISFESALIKAKIDFRTVCDLCTISDDDFLLNIGFTNLTKSPYIKKPSSWDKAFYSIFDNNLCDIYNYFFFIEDDVYSQNYTSLINFIIKCRTYKEDLITKSIRPKTHHPTWRYWKDPYVNDLKFPSQSFNPLCRISNRLIEKIIEYKNRNQNFNFHEILIASLCLENNLSYINYIENRDLNKYFGKIEYSPIMTKDMIHDDLIYHPVKENINEREKPVVSLDS